MAARSKFTARTRAIILEALDKGHTLTHAAGLAGVDRDTVYNWLAKGEKATSGRFAEFREGVHKANARAADRAVDAIREAMPDDWRAAITYLERRFPDEWSKRERHEVSGPKGEPIKVELNWPTEPKPPR